MKYETPELTPLTPAIDAVQDGKNPDKSKDNGGSGLPEMTVAAYEDWE